MDLQQKSVETGPSMNGNVELDTVLHKISLVIGQYSLKLSSELISPYAINALWFA
jgi:hypothetical protein